MQIFRTQINYKKRIRKIRIQKICLLLFLIFYIIGIQNLKFDSKLTVPCR